MQVAIVIAELTLLDVRLSQLIGENRVANCKVVRDCAGTPP